jgi:hypothetical protein
VNEHGEPKWLAATTRLYGVALWLYPASLRRAHGDEMREAFRARCLEAASGRVGAWRVFGLELFPDFIASLSLARTEEAMYSSSRRPVLGLAVLVLLAAILLVQGTLSPLLLNATFAVKAHWEHWNEERALVREEGQVRGLAERLAASAETADRALAANLFRANELGRRDFATYTIGYPKPLGFAPLEADGARASELLASVPANASGQVAWLAARACQVDPRCDQYARTRTLVQAEPDNGYAWALLLQQHSLAGNDAAVLADLHSISLASRFDDHEQATRVAILAAAERMAPGDAQLIAAVARRVAAVSASPTDDFRHGLRFLCSNNRNYSGPHWLEANPASRGDCAAAARLAARTGSPGDSAWGWRWLDQEQSTPATRARVAAAEESRSAFAWPGWTSTGEHAFRPWTDAEWQAWARKQQDAARSP